MQSPTRSLLAFVLLTGSAGCGDDPKPADINNTQSDDTEDASTGEEDDENETDSSDVDPTTGTPDDTETDPLPPDGDLPDPVLEELPPETPLSELDEDQLAEVCAAYLDTSTSLANNLDGVCPAQAVLTASQSGATENAELQTACSDATDMCVAQVAESKVALETADCTQAEECGASIADFNACNRQVAALNEMVIVPVGEMQTPECATVTAAQARGFALSAGLQVLILMDGASEAAGGSPTDPGGPCERIQAECPELGAVLDAFAGLDLPELPQ